MLGVVQVACGNNHSVALSADGELYSWGHGKYGQLGCGEYEKCCQPQRVPLEARISQASCSL